MHGRILPGRQVHPALFPHAYARAYVGGRLRMYHRIKCDDGTNETGSESSNAKGTSAAKTLLRSRLTHVDAETGLAAMVDVGGKAGTHRTAMAEGHVRL